MKTRNFKTDFDRKYYVNRIIRIIKKTKPDTKVRAELEILIEELKQYEL